MTTLIIGTGQAGCTVAREWRRRAPEARILMLTEDDGRVYSKPMLSSAFKDAKTPAQLVMQDLPTFATRQKLDAQPHAAVEALDLAARCVRLRDGSTHAWQHLVLAVGAAQRVLPIPGVEHVLTVNNLPDYERFRTALTPGGRVVVIGGGLIGSEFAHDLTTAGYAVTVVEPLGWPLATLVPDAVGHALQTAMAGMGVTWRFGRKAVGVQRQANGRFTVELDDGSELPADTVLAATGLVPRTELARAAGLATHRGIRTDRCMRTSAEGVYAVGDCAEVEGHVMPYIMPIMFAARALVATALGQPTPAAFPVMPVLVKTPVHPVVVASPPKPPALWEVETAADGVTARALDAGGRLIGFALSGAAATMTQQQALADNTVNPWA